MFGELEHFDELVVSEPNLLQLLVVIVYLSLDVLVHLSPLVLGLEELVALRKPSVEEQLLLLVQLQLVRDIDPRCGLQADEFFQSRSCYSDVMNPFLNFLQEELDSLLFVSFIQVGSLPRHLEGVSVFDDCLGAELVALIVVHPAGHDVDVNSVVQHSGVGDHCDPCLEGEEVSLVVTSSFWKQSDTCVFA